MPVENNKDYTLSAILHYVNESQTTGALLLTGKWGSGKTWFINNTLKKELTDKRPLITVSLFGINSVEQFRKEVALASYGVKAGGQKSKLKESIKKATSFLEGITFLKGYIDLGTYIEMVPFPKDAIILFDDFERCKLEPEVSLGLINHYIESKKLKVIIVASEEMINDDYYKTFKEKVIALTVEYQPDYKYITGSIISGIKNKEYKDFLLLHSNELQKWLSQECKSNLRLLIRAIQHYERVFCAVHALLDEHKDDYEYLDLFYTEYFQKYSSYFLKINCKDILNSEAKSTNDSIRSALEEATFHQNPIVRWIEKYEWEQKDIENDILNSADKYKTASAINKLLRTYYYTDGILTLDDEVLVEGWKQLIEQLEKGALKRSDFERMYGIDRACVRLEIFPNPQLDFDLMRRYAKNHESIDTLNNLRYYLNYAYHLPSNQSSELYELYNKMFIKYESDEKEEKLEAFFKDFDTDKLRNLFLFPSNEYGGRIASIFNSCTNTDKNKIIDAFSNYYRFWFDKETSNFKQRELEFLSGIKDNLDGNTSKPIGEKLYNKFLELINERLEPLTRTPTPTTPLPDGPANP